VHSLFEKYINTFRGLSREIWLLAGITLVNRAGMMVIPFLSIYLTTEIGLSLQQVGWIMTCFGLGSLLGAWSGGKLTDKIGGYRVMFGSFILGGIGFILLQYLHDFQSICIGVFFLTLVADAFRPALFVAMSNYAKPENKTRSVTLIRLAINLGMSLGPSVGGVLILYFGYSALFWLDGATNITAGILLIILLNPKKRKAVDLPVEVANPLSPYKDGYYLLLLAGLYIFTIAFLQYFSSMPVYYRSVIGLSEGQIGLLMGMNGFLIFLIEMPIVQYFDSRNYNKAKLLIFGLSLLCLSFLILPFTSWGGVVIISVLLMTIGEIFVFPFANTLAVNRAKKGKQGEYMALFSMNFSIAHIFGHNIGMQSAEHFGFNSTWFVIAGICGVGMFVFYLLSTK
jgi:predicted MFS family arabinose efflux permease